MNAVAHHTAPAFDGHPHYSDRLRIAFEPLPGLPEPDLALKLEEEAMGHLQLVLAIEEIAPRAKDEEGEHTADFLRVERKLDLVLELLAMRLRDEDGATEQEVWFSADGARWKWPEGDPPPAGTIGIVSIGLNRLLPRPLRMPVQVMSDEPGWIHAGFLRMGDNVEDLLVRHVFLRHRRGLAGARRARRA
jgi:hypothetical protein